MDSRNLTGSAITSAGSWLRGSVATSCPSLFVCQHHRPDVPDPYASRRIRQFSARAIGVGSACCNQPWYFAHVRRPKSHWRLAQAVDQLVGINPQGGALLPNIGQHVAVIVWVTTIETRTRMARENHRFPYPEPPDSTQVAPYVRAGGELVQTSSASYQHRFTHRRNLAWANTIYGIH